MKAFRTALPSLLFLLGACATAEKSNRYFLEDSYARYYDSADGKVLRVEGDGTVLDVSCLPLDFAKDTPRKRLPEAVCPGEKVPVLGQAKRAGDDWDLAPFSVAPPSGRCKPLLAPLAQKFSDPDWGERTQRTPRSCWNRLWEVPAAAVLYPAVSGLLLGIATAPIWVPLLFF